MEEVTAGGATAASAGGFEGGLTRDAGSSTCAEFRQLRVIHDVTEALTVPNAEYFIDKTFISQLCQEWCYHVNAAVNDD